jgi:predicted metal-binding protein
MISTATANRLTQLVQQAGATHTATVEIPNIVFNESLRDMCAMNSCGKYGTCWVCPPAVGPVEQWRAKVESFDGGVIIQTVYQLEDSFDFEGMGKAAVEHKANFDRAVEAIRTEFADDELLCLNAGSCGICAKCTYPEAPCRFPERAVVSVEACGIDFNNTLVSCGLKYNNGSATVSYVGMVLLKTHEEL